MAILVSPLQTPLQSMRRLCKNVRRTCLLVRAMQQNLPMHHLQDVTILEYTTGWSQALAWGRACLAASAHASLTGGSAGAPLHDRTNTGCAQALNGPRLLGGQRARLLGGRTNLQVHHWMIAPTQAMPRPWHGAAPAWRPARAPPATLQVHHCTTAPTQAVPRPWHGAAPAGRPARAPPCPGPCAAHARARPRPWPGWRGRPRARARRPPDVRVLRFRV